MHQYLAAAEKHAVAARAAYALFLTYYPNAPRVPGCDTVIRLAWRIELGRTIESAAAYEYLYRWALAIKPGDQVTIDGGMLNSASSVFGAPHTIGL